MGLNTIRYPGNDATRSASVLPHRRLVPLMTDTEAVYRYGSTRGEVVERHEVGPDTLLPSVGDTITLSDSGSEGRFVVKYRFPPSHASLELNGVLSAYSLGR